MKFIAIMNPIKNNNINNVIFASLDRGIVAIYGFIYIIYFAKILPKTEFGLFTLANGICILCITLCDLSVGQALIHFGSGKPDKEFLIVSKNAFILKIILFIFSAFLLILIIPILPILFGENNLNNIIKILPLWVLLILLYNTSLQMLQAKESFRKILYIDCFLVLILLIGIGISTTYNLIKNAQNALLFLILIRLISLFFSQAFFPWKFIIVRIKKSSKIIKALFKYSKSSFANSLGVFIFSKTDIFMLGFMLNPTFVAQYSSAAVIMNLFRLMNEPINMVVFPIISKLKSKNIIKLNEKIKNIYRKASLGSFAISLPISLLLIIFSQKIMFLLYGEKYIESATLVKFFALWGLILPFYRCAASIFNGLGKPEINAKLTWLSAIINILLNLVLIYYFKTLGAVLASVLTSAFLLILYMNKLSKFFKIFSLSGPLSLKK